MANGAGLSAGWPGPAVPVCQPGGTADLIETTNADLMRAIAEVRDLARGDQFHHQLQAAMVTRSPYWSHWWGRRVVIWLRCRLAGFGRDRRWMSDSHERDRHEATLRERLARKQPVSV